jgi:hypothetical protein
MALLSHVTIPSQRRRSSSIIQSHLFTIEPSLVGLDLHPFVITTQMEKKTKKTYLYNQEATQVLFLGKK